MKRLLFLLSISWLTQCNAELVASSLPNPPKDEFGCRLSDLECRWLQLHKRGRYELEILDELVDDEFAPITPTMTLQRHLPKDGSNIEKTIMGTLNFAANVSRVLDMENELITAASIRGHGFPQYSNQVGGILVFSTSNSDSSEHPIDRAILDAKGNFGLSQLEPQFPLHVGGASSHQIGIYTEGSVMASYLYHRADRREWNNVTSADTGLLLQRIASLNLRNYKLSAETGDRMYTGIAGQEAKNILPSAVKTAAGINIEDGTGQLRKVTDFHVLDDSVVLATNVGATQELYHNVLDLQGKMQRTTHDMIRLKETANSTETAEARVRAAKAEMEAMTHQLEARKAMARAEAEAIEQEMEARKLAANAEAELAREQAKIAMLNKETAEAEASIHISGARVAEAEAKSLEFKSHIAKHERDREEHKSNTTALELEKTNVQVVIETTKLEQLAEERKKLEAEVSISTEKRLTEEAIAMAAKEAAAQELTKLKTAEEKVMEARIVESQKLAEIETAKLTSLTAKTTLESERVRVEGDKENIARKLQNDKDTNIHQDDLSRQRTLDALKAEEESHAKRELMHMDSVREEHNLELDKEKLRLEWEVEARVAAVEAEGRLKIQQARENEDIDLRRQAKALESDRSKLIESIKVGFQSFGEGAINFLNDKEKISRTIFMVIAVAAGIYFARESISLVRTELQRRMGKPSLVRETSKSTGQFSLWRSFMRWARNEKPMDVFKDVILESQLLDRVKKLAKATRNARINHAPFRHVMFYGPPGTGKTMVAKRLAWQSGMEYAIMSGGDVGPLGADAVTELHRLFDWAKRSSRGVLLFIDEADAFLGSRSRGDMSEHMRNALNALLYQTGEEGQSRHFMLVLATNRPGDLDKAVTDRIDESLNFDLPMYDSRLQLVSQYFSRYVAPVSIQMEQPSKSKNVNPAATGKGKKNRQIKNNPNEEILQVHDDSNKLIRTMKAMITKKAPPIILTGVKISHIESLTSLTEGFSGREIEKLMIAIQSSVYGSDSLVLTASDLLNEISFKVVEHKNKEQLRENKGNNDWS